MGNNSSVLPTIKPEQDETGKYQIISEFTGFNEGGFLGVLGLAFLLVPTYILVTNSVEMISNKGFLSFLSEVFFRFFNPTGLFGIGVLIFLLFIGAALVISSFRKIRLAYHIEGGRFLFTSWPLKLGQTVNVTFEQNFSDDLNITEMRMGLTCEGSFEASTEDDKKSTTTTKSVVAQELETFTPGENHQGSLSQKISFTIPEDAPPSFERSGHKYEWYLKVDFEFESFKNETLSAKLLVIPEVTKNS